MIACSVNLLEVSNTRVLKSLGVVKIVVGLKGYMLNERVVNITNTKSKIIVVNTFNNKQAIIDSFNKIHKFDGLTDNEIGQFGEVVVSRRTLIVDKFRDNIPIRQGMYNYL